MNEAMGESRTESLVRDVREAVVGVAGESGVAGGRAGQRRGAPWLLLAKNGSRCHCRRRL